MSISALTNAISYFNKYDSKQSGSVLAVGPVASQDLNQDGKVNLVESAVSGCRTLVECSLNFILATNLSILYKADSTPEQQALAVQTLAGIGEPAIEPLLSLLDNPAESVRTLASNALLKIGPMIVAPLVKFLVVGEYNLDNSAGNEAQIEAGHQAGYDLMENLGLAAVDNLLNLLVSGERSISAMANRFIYGVSSEKAIAVFREVFLTASDRGARMDMVDNLSYSLGSTGDEFLDDEILHVLTLALKDSDPVIRQFTAWNLGWSDDERAVGLLAQSLTDPNKGVASTALRAILVLTGEVTSSSFELRSNDDLFGSRPDDYLFSFYVMEYLADRRNAE
jgi:HEAT repeat protein